VAAADAALLVLSELCSVAEARLEAEGWDPTTAVASAAGATVYRHRESRATSETPALSDDADRGWRGRLLQQVPILATPCSLDNGKTTSWAVQVVRLDVANDGDHGSVAVLDCLMSEEDGCDGPVAAAAAENFATATTPTTVVMRGLYRGQWRGFDHPPVDQAPHPRRAASPQLESFAHTTMCGMIEAWAPRRGARVLLAGVGCGSVARFLCHHGGAASSSGGNITADTCTTTASSTRSASDQCNGSASAGGSGDIVDTPTEGDTEACSSRNSSHNAEDRSDDSAQQWRQVEVVERSKAIVTALPLWGPLPSGVTVHHAEYDCWTANAAAVDVASAVAGDDDTAGSSLACVTAVDSHRAASTALFDALIVDDDEADAAVITSLRRYLAPDGLMLVRSSAHAVMELAGALAHELRGRGVVLQEQKLRGEGDEEEDDMAEYNVGVDGTSSKNDGDADVQDPGSVAVFMQGGPRELSTEAWARATGMLQPSHANHLV
jgi:hypothetical protein